MTKKKWIFIAIVFLAIFIYFFLPGAITIWHPFDHEVVISGRDPETAYSGSWVKLTGRNFTQHSVFFCTTGAQTPRVRCKDWIVVNSTTAFVRIP
ncbi:MAG TPA: hypothetical protein VND65_06900 [Candidatus Binatia bacterium]|nr:hypothetical protein [Candidatus Binatia bacterium]